MEGGRGALLCPNPWSGGPPSHLPLQLQELGEILTQKHPPPLPPPFPSISDPEIKGDSHTGGTPPPFHFSSGDKGRFSHSPPIPIQLQGILIQEGTPPPHFRSVFTTRY